MTQLNRLVYSVYMSNKPSTRERLLDAGYDLIGAGGYADTGLNDMLAAAGVPKGSFYHHFANKEAFGLEVVDRYAAGALAELDRWLAREDLAPRSRVCGFFAAMIEDFGASGYNRGCLLGNLGQELADISEAFRVRIDAHLARMTERLAAALNSRLEAEAIMNGWHGALMRMKVSKSEAPLRAFIDHHFGAAPEDRAA